MDGAEIITALEQMQEHSKECDQAAIVLEVVGSLAAISLLTGLNTVDIFRTAIKEYREKRGIPEFDGDAVALIRDRIKEAEEAEDE